MCHDNNINSSQTSEYYRMAGWETTGEFRLLTTLSPWFIAKSHSLNHSSILLASPSFQSNFWVLQDGRVGDNRRVQTTDNPFSMVYCKIPYFEPFLAAHAPLFQSNFWVLQDRRVGQQDPFSVEFHNLNHSSIILASPLVLSCCPTLPSCNTVWLELLSWHIQGFIGFFVWEGGRPWRGGSPSCRSMKAFASVFLWELMLY